MSRTRARGRAHGALRPLRLGANHRLGVFPSPNDNLNALTVLNGYKDEDYLRLALLGNKLGRKAIVVIEKFSELHKILKLSREMNVEPMIGTGNERDQPYTNTKPTSE